MGGVLGQLFLLAAFAPARHRELVSQKKGCLFSAGLMPSACRGALPTASRDMSAWFALHAGLRPLRASPWGWGPSQAKPHILSPGVGRQH